MKTTEYYQKITEIFYDNTRNGFVDWRQCGPLCRQMNYFIEKAKRELSAEGRYKDLFEVTNKAFLKWADTDKDDSDGQTQDFCADVVDAWNHVYKNGEEDISHAEMMKFYMDHLDGSVVDYMMDFLYDFLLNNFKTKDELIQKEEFLKNQMEQTKSEMREKEIRVYHLYVLEEYYIRVLADLNRPIEEIRNFVSKSSGYSIVDILAGIETKYGNYEEALAIYSKRISERPDPYWSDAPRKKMMEIYKLTGDKATYNKTLYDIMMTHTGSSDYFKEYKALFSEEEWPAEWKKILDKLREMNISACIWYEIEGRYDLIMDCVEPDNSALIEYYKKLEDLYPERCLKVLINDANNTVKIAKYRGDYRYVAEILWKMQKYEGGQEIANNLASKYIAEYPRRIALAAELSVFLGEINEANDEAFRMRGLVKMTAEEEQGQKEFEHQLKEIEDILFYGNKEEIDAIKCPLCGGNTYIDYSIKYNSFDLRCKPCGFRKAYRGWLSKYIEDQMEAENEDPKEYKSLRQNTDG